MYSLDMGMEFDTEKMYHAHNEKRKNGRIRSSQLAKNTNTPRKGKLQVLANTGSGHHRTSGHERKKRVPQMIKKSY